MSSFNVSEYNSYILIKNENTSSGKLPTQKQHFVTNPVINKEMKVL